MEMCCSAVKLHFYVAGIYEICRHTDFGMERRIFVPETEIKLNKKEI